MTLLAIAHKALKGDLNNSHKYNVNDNNIFLYLHMDGEYCTYDHKLGLMSYTYISTVEEFNNFKVDNMKVYTQEMADNGVSPSVGMECLILFSSSHYSGTITYIGDGIGCFKELSGKEHTFAFHSVTFRPLTPNKTDKEKAIDDLDRIITDAYQDASDSYISKSRFKSEAIRLLDEIIDGEIHGVSFQPLTSIELIDGGRYEFELCFGDYRLGYWKEERNSFFDSLLCANKICGKSEASNIQPLTVETK
jgi:hypothetical protein